MSPDPIDELRRLSTSGPAPSAALTPYLDKVRHRAYAVTDRDVEELRAAGLSEEEIFEATVQVAIEEGLRRLDAAGAVLG